jgi:dimethylargininase
MFTNAIVRVPGFSMQDGLSSSRLGRPDVIKACEQHSAYVDALRNQGLTVRVLEENERYPDSTFIEDVALCTPFCAVVASPGAESRRGEIIGIRPLLEEYYNEMEEIRFPGTLEAGDVMTVGNHYYIGISGRTNIEGADQLITILNKYKLSGIKVPLENMLHLKSGISYLENNIILVCGELTTHKEFEKFNRIQVSNDESYAANSLWINGKVLVPEGFPETRNKIEKAGYETIVLDVSEFRKVDGGLSCLSLRF